MFKSLYICKNKKTNYFEITDFHDINIKLEVYDSGITQAQLVQFDQNILIAYLSKGNQTINFFEFKYVEKQNNIMIFYKQVNSNQFLLNETNIKSFKLFKFENKKVASFLIINNKDNKFILREFNTEHNNFNSNGNVEIANIDHQMIEEVKC